MIGEQLNHYRIIAKLGEGGMAEVYRADDTRLGRQVALKVLPAAFAEDSTRVERFEREAKAIAALNHPNIVTIYSVEEAEGLRFLTMELVDGESLQQIIPPEGMDLPQFHELARPLLDAVAAAHRKGIVHRDIKPANVMVNSEGIVKLLDLGLAKLDPALNPDASTIDETLTAEGHVIGTVPYMAPEQLAGQPLDHRIDIYALGVVFYEMLTGARPFAAASTAELISAILRDPPQRLAETRDSLPSGLEESVGRCLEKAPEDRFETVDQLRETLDGALASTSSAATVVTGRPPERPPALEARIPSAAARRIPPWLLVAGITIAVAAVAAVIFSLVAPSSRAVTPPPVGLGIGLLPLEEHGEPADPGFTAAMSQVIRQELGTLDDLELVELDGSAQDGDSTEETPFDYTLSGSVEWSGTEESAQAQIGFEMTRTADGATIWTESFGRPEIATPTARRAIAANVRARIGDLLGLPSPPAPSLREASVATGATRAGPRAETVQSKEPAPLDTAVDEPDLSASTAASEPVASEQEAAAPAAAEVEVKLSVTSNLPSAVITVYVDGIRVYQRELEFSERKGGLLGKVGLKKKVGGELEDGMLVPLAATEIRTYVAVPGEPARQHLLTPALRGDGTDRLLIDIRKKQDIVVTME